MVDVAGHEAGLRSSAVPVDLAAGSDDFRVTRLRVVRELHEHSDTEASWTSTQPGAPHTMKPHTHSMG